MTMPCLFQPLLIGHAGALHPLAGIVTVEFGALFRYRNRRLIRKFSAQM